MTAKQRSAYSEANARILKRMEPKYVTLIYDALLSQVKVFTKYLRDSSIVHARQELDRIIINQQLREPITEIYRAFAIYAINKTGKEISASVRKSFRRNERKAGFGVNEQLLNRILRWLLANLLLKVIIPITEHLKQDILAALQKAEAEGLGEEETARMLESEDFLLWRAKRIVRTESLFSMQYGQEATAEVSDWETEKEWIAAHDHRTRHSHRDVDGNRVAEGKRFRVPIYQKGIIVGHDYMTGPGDRSASLGNFINCRCTLVTNAARDKNGRLIPKKVGNSKISVILPQDVFKPTQIITV